MRSHNCVSATFFYYQRVERASFVMRIVSLGEIMLRLEPHGYARFLQASEFGAVYGGSEANVCVSLSHFCHETVFVTKLPKNALGNAAINDLRKYGVNTEFVARGGERLGIYFLETGASQRSSKVIYDRKNSSFSTSCINDYNLDEIFKNAKWFHFSGITPALSPDSAELCLSMIKHAKKIGITVSFDVNYRANLWSYEQAAAVLPMYMPYIDILFCGYREAKEIFNITVDDKYIENGYIIRDGYRDLCDKMVSTLGVKAIATTLRDSISASDNELSGMLFCDNKLLFAKNYSIRIVDRVGGGDAFAAGLINGFLDENMSKEEALEFAVAASVLKHTIEGDFNMVSANEVADLAMGGNSSVKR